MIELHVPPSKSVTQRGLILAMLSDRPCRIVNPLVCDDSLHLGRAMEALGVRVDRRDGAWHITPPDELVAGDRPLFLGNAGTAVRFLTGAALAFRGSVVIDGNEAMRQRPMPGLLQALRELGAEIAELGAPSCPPLRVTPPAVPGDGARLDASVSSQQLSALLMVAPRLERGLRVELTGDLPSAPYVRLTELALDSFGVAVERTGDAFVVPPGAPVCDRFVVEGDWSSASYPLAAGWLTHTPVKLSGVAHDSRQGDRAIVTLLEALATHGPRRFDMGTCPDIVPTVAACALFAPGTTEIRGVAHMRIKESNRIEGLVTELARLGADIEELEDGMRIRASDLHGPATLRARDDHRLAMAFGLVSLRVPGVSVDNPACVSKSYPDFWRMLERFR